MARQTPDLLHHVDPNLLLVWCPHVVLMVTAVQTVAVLGATAWSLFLVEEGSMCLPGTRVRRGGEQVSVHVQ